MHFKNHKLIM